MKDNKRKEHQEMIVATIRKAANDVFEFVAGSINSQEKLAQHRFKLTKPVWQGTTDSGAREGRHCHGDLGIDRYDGIAHKEAASGHDIREAVINRIGPSIVCGF